MDKNHQMYLKTFNTHFVDFVTDVQNVFPEDPDLLTAKTSLLFISKNNPKMVAKIWKKYINGKYKKEIMEGNLDFFLDKDYRSDVEKSDNSEQITQCIDRLRGPIREMGEENRLKSIKYIQNLTKLADLLVV
jgi:hypothetical protein